MLFSLKQEKFGKDKLSDFHLFVSPGGKKDLLFKDSAIGFERVPPKVDIGLYLGFGYSTAILNLRKSKRPPGRSPRVPGPGRKLWVGSALQCSLNHSGTDRQTCVFCQPRHCEKCLQKMSQAPDWCFHIPLCMSGSRGLLLSEK